MWDDWEEADRHGVRRASPAHGGVPTRRFTRLSCRIQAFDGPLPAAAPTVTATGSLTEPSATDWPACSRPQTEADADGSGTDPSPTRILHGGRPEGSSAVSLCILPRPVQPSVITGPPLPPVRPQQTLAERQVCAAPRRIVRRDSPNAEVAVQANYARARERIFGRSSGDTSTTASRTLGPSSTARSQQQRNCSTTTSDASDRVARAQPAGEGDSQKPDAHRAQENLQ